MLLSFSRLSQRTRPGLLITLHEKLFFPESEYFPSGGTNADNGRHDPDLGITRLNGELGGPRQYSG